MYKRQRLGFQRVIVPKSFVPSDGLNDIDINLIKVNNIEEAIKKF